MAKSLFMSKVAGSAKNTVTEYIPNPENSIQIPIKCEIISHCQEKFDRILKLDGIGPEDLIRSLNVESNRNMVFRAGQSAGASGSFFFFSKDSRFLIKTL